MAQQMASMNPGAGVNPLQPGQDPDKLYQSEAENLEVTEFFSILDGIEERVLHNYASKEIRWWVLGARKELSVILFYIHIEEIQTECPLILQTIKYHGVGYLHFPAILHNRQMRKWILQGTIGHGKPFVYRDVNVDYGIWKSRSMHISSFPPDKHRGFCVVIARMMQLFVIS